jgi:hypothetical protein
VDAQLDARRWQRVGRALVLHNGRVHDDERIRIALINCGPRAVVTAFTAAESCGLTGWHRSAVHVLVPAGARILRPPGLELRVHWTGAWRTTPRSRGVHALAPALALAAATFRSVRPAVGILAAGVQQRLVRSDDLLAAVVGAPRMRHRSALLTALHDIAQGAEALSEIDFARLCRRHGLPEPIRQGVRRELSGRRRYLDAEWVTRTGRRLVAEVDGALHLTAQTWWADQQRQNEITLADHIVLRFPSIVVRTDEATVAAQLRRALDL